jgi:hypothetical protein
MHYTTFLYGHNVLHLAHHCVTEVVHELMKELEKDPTGLNTKSKGFLELW